jgi:uncharacterized protein (TIGR00297 family)
MPGPAHHYNEDLRQLEHLAPICFSFLLKYLTWPQALACASCAVLYSLLSARLFTGTQRPDEVRRGVSPGKLVYALSVFFLILLFPDQKFIVVTVWANLSVGDAISNLLGRHYGKTVLPWNRQKTWIGLIAAFFASSFSSYVLILWIGLPSEFGSPQATAWSLALAASLVCSMVETLPLPIDDNISICLAGALFLSWLSKATLPEAVDFARAGIGLGISSAVAITAFLLHTVTRGGILSGMAIGVCTFYSFQWQGFLLLAACFALGRCFAKLGAASRTSLPSVRDENSIRGARRVWDKGIAPLLAALASIFLPAPSPARVAFVAALAAALCDTTAKEFGLLLGRRPFQPGNLRHLAPGTPGANTFAGAVSGSIAALMLACGAYLLQFTSAWGMLWAAIAAVIAGNLESYLLARPSKAPENDPWANAFHAVLSMIIAVLLTKVRL